MAEEDKPWFVRLWGSFSYLFFNMGIFKHLKCSWHLIDSCSEIDYIVTWSVFCFFWFAFYIKYGTWSWTPFEMGEWQHNANKVKWIIESIYIYTAAVFTIACFWLTQLHEFQIFVGKKCCIFLHSMTMDGRLSETLTLDDWNPKSKSREEGKWINTSESG